MRDAPTTILVTACGAIIGGIGAAVFVPALRARRVVGASRAWPSVRGTIAESRIEETVYRRSIGKSTRTRTSYRPVVAYDYSVDGFAHRGARIYFGSVVGSSDEASPRAELARYPVGTAVDVFFDPKDHDASVLERRAAKLPITIGALMVFVGATFAIFALAACGAPSAPPPRVGSPPLAIDAGASSPTVDALDKSAISDDAERTVAEHCSGLVYKNGCHTLRHGAIELRVELSHAGSSTFHVTSNTVDPDADLVLKCVKSALASHAFPSIDMSFDLVFVLADMC